MHPRALPYFDRRASSGFLAAPPPEHRRCTSTTSEIPTSIPVGAGLADARRSILTIGSVVGKRRPYGSQPGAHIGSGIMTAAFLALTVCAPLQAQPQPPTAPAGQPAPKAGTDPLA